MSEDNVSQKSDESPKVDDEKMSQGKLSNDAAEGISENTRSSKEVEEKEKPGSIASSAVMKPLDADVVSEIKQQVPGDEPIENLSQVYD